MQPIPVHWSTGQFSRVHEAQSDRVSAGQAFDILCSAPPLPAAARLEAALPPMREAGTDEDEEMREDGNIDGVHLSGPHQGQEISELDLSDEPQTDAEITSDNLDRLSGSGIFHGYADHPSSHTLGRPPKAQTDRGAESPTLPAAGDEVMFGGANQTPNSGGAVPSAPIASGAPRLDDAVGLPLTADTVREHGWRASHGLSSAVRNSDNAILQDGTITLAPALGDPAALESDVDISRTPGSGQTAHSNSRTDDSGSARTHSLSIAQAETEGDLPMDQVRVLRDAAAGLLNPGCSPALPSDVTELQTQIAPRQEHSFDSKPAPMRSGSSPSASARAAGDGVARNLHALPDHASPEDKVTLANAMPAPAQPLHESADSLSRDIAPLAVPSESPGTTDATDIGAARPVVRTPVPVHRQLADAIVTTRDGVTEITLSPEELGRVKIVISRDDHLTRLNIVVERPETLDLVRRHADLLVRELRDSGTGQPEISFAASDGRGQQGQNRGSAANALPAPPADLQNAHPQQHQPNSTIGRPNAGVAGERRIDIRI